MGIQIVSSKVPEDLFQKTAVAFLSHLVPISKEREVMLGLCGGRSVVGLITAIKNFSFADSQAGKDVRALLNKVHFFMVDERLVPLTDPDSNYGMLKKNLFDDLLREGIVKPEQLHPFIPVKEEIDYGTSGYGKEFKQYSARFDGVVLGVGEDGHIAGLFPRHPTLKRAEPIFVSFFDSPKPPAGRMTATLPLVMDTVATVLLFTGEGKRNAWERFNAPSTPPEECPSIFMKGCQNLLIATDLA
jgi:6-phosphogluconolactonase